ncbi:MAG: GNAT family N-acetyltransferase, partial [Gemmatimonadota bacterium]
RHYAGWVSPPTTPAQYAAYLGRCQQENHAGLFVCGAGTGAIIGAVDLSQIYHGPLQSCYMGYQIGAAYAGQGHMTEALNLVLRQAFTTRGLHRVEANIQPGNTASIALARRVGFRLEGFSPRYLKIRGRWRDHERWAMLREDWQRMLPRHGDR